MGNETILSLSERACPQGRDLRWKSKPELRKAEEPGSQGGLLTSRQDVPRLEETWKKARRLWKVQLGNGKGGLVGSTRGSCCFRLQLSQCQEAPRGCDVAWGASASVNKGAHQAGLPAGRMAAGAWWFRSQRRPPS